MIETLNNAFKDYVFTEENHTYLHTPTNTQLTSVTGLLKKLCPKFNYKFWRPYKTFQRNGYEVTFENNITFLVNGERFNPNFNSTLDYDLEFTEEDLQYEWELLARIGNTRGSYLHNYMENLWNRKVLPSDVPLIINSLPALEAIRYIKSLDTLKILAKNLHSDLSKNHVPVAIEYVVGDIDANLAGMFDALLFNTDTQEYELWDYKTDKKLKETGYELVSGFKVPYCELNKYSLQLGIYKYILEKNTDIKIGKCFIAHFNLKNNTVDVIETNDYTEIIKDYFINEHNKSTHFKYSGSN